MWALLINPVSGKGKGVLIGKKVAGFLRKRSINYTIVTGNNPLFLSEHLANFLAKNSDCEGVIAVGGDGLMHLALQQVVPRHIPFTIIAAGTGNDFLRSLGWDLIDFENQLEKVVTTPARGIDLGLVDGEWFGVALSSGFDAKVNERANSMNWPKGAIRYKFAIALELPQFRAQNFKISVDDRDISTQAMLVAVANGRSYGGGLNVCPNASVFDGFFDVMILHSLSTIEFIKVFPTIFNGTHINHPAVEIIRSKKVRIDSKTIAYSDGERIGALPVQAECIPEALLSWVR